MNIVVTIFECHYLTSATDCDFIKVLVLNGLVGNPWLESWMQQILCSTPLCVLLRLTIVFWQDMFVQYMYFANALDIGVTSCFPVLQLYFFLVESLHCICRWSLLFSRSRQEFVFWRIWIIHDLMMVRYFW